jgi:glutathione S-transferase
MSLEFVDISAARAARGVRIVVSGLVPSPWSEAAKGLFRIAKVPVLAVRRMRDAADITTWTGIDNVPVVFYDAQPARTHWAAITELASRLAGPDVLLPESIPARADHIGLIGTIAGEDGIGWNARLAMIDASFATSGARGFPLPVAKYLSARYGHTPDAMSRSRERIAAQLAMFADRLGSQPYIAGKLSAVDVYLATFLTPLTAISETDCPTLEPVLRQAFGSAHEALGSLVPPSLLAHRKMMFERHLAYPIVI